LIYLPPKNPSVTESTGRIGKERILLVEDNAAVRLTTRRLLGKFGYHVIEAASGQEALEIWRSQEATIDLLLTDLVMPGGISGPRPRKTIAATKAGLESGLRKRVQCQRHRRRHGFPQPGAQLFFAKTVFVPNPAGHNAALL